MTETTNRWAKFRIVAVPIETVLLAFFWIAIAVIGRLSRANHLPLAIMYFWGSLIVAGTLAVTDRRIPGFSLRLMASAVTTGTLMYVLAPFCCLVSLRILPSVMGVLAFSSIPIIVSLLTRFTGDKFIHFIAFAVGFVVVYIGVRPEADLRADSYLALIILIGYPVFSAMGMFLSRRLFWTHSPVDLNFWAMLLASAVHFAMAGAYGEVSLAGEWPPIYWTYLAYLTVIPTGFGYALYQFAARGAGTLDSMLYTLITPLAGLAIGYSLWGESPVNVMVGIGMGFCMIVLFFDSWSIRPSRWMCHFLHNDSRTGDRLLCHLDAILHNTTVGTHVQIVDLSIGGLGFRSEVSFPKGEKMRVEFPIANSGGTVMLDCKVVHMTQRDSKDFPWSGGLDFQKMSPEKSQYVVEFLAKLASAIER